MNNTSHVLVPVAQDLTQQCGVHQSALGLVFSWFRETLPLLHVVVAFCWQPGAMHLIQ